MYDVIIIGIGASGAASTRGLSRYKVNTCVPKRGEDVCCGTSKANSAIAHVGYDTAEGSFMVRLSVEGNQIIPELARELDFPFNPYESFMACLDEESLPDLRALYEWGVKNGIKDLEIITDKARVEETESNLANEVTGILYMPTTGIVCPFNPDIALVGNVYTNGVDFKFNTRVTDIHKIEGGRALEIGQGVYETRHMISAAGIYTDKFHNMASGTKIRIIPRRGGYCLLGKSAGNHVNRTIFTLPGKYGKDILVSPTVYGNLIVGLTVIDIEDKEATTTTREGLDELTTKAEMNAKDLPVRQVVTSFAGLRAHKDHHEFIIKELEDTPGFADCVGIESPGPTSCPAVGRTAAGILKEKLELELNTQFNNGRERILDLDTLTKEEQAELIKQNPVYESIMCRCKMVTGEEILDAVYRPLGACSPDSTKHRTEAGMGRCQAGFCTLRSIELLHCELGLPMTEIIKVDGDPELVVRTNKDRIQKRACAR